MKRFLLLLIVTFYPISRFCHHQTKGFRISKVVDNVSCIEGQHSFEMPDELRLLCRQHFTYLGRGLQSFSFVSEDGTMVLKLFNNRYRRLLNWFRMPFVKKIAKRRIAELETKWRRTFESYELAATAFKEESGLLFFHPSICKNCPVVTIVDPLGNLHRINLARHAFALQKRAMGSFAFFLNCARTHDFERARQGLDSLIALIQRKFDLGLRDQDPLIRTNIGFIGAKAMQIDLGPFSLELNRSDAKTQKGEILHILMGLQSFMESETPSLLPLLYEAINHL